VRIKFRDQGRGVGIGDPIGALDTAILKRSVRADGVTAKPDRGLVPTDAIYVAEAQAPAAAMVATASSDHH
jgi:hypothetical protein